MESQQGQGIHTPEVGYMYMFFFSVMLKKLTYSKSKFLIVIYLINLMFKNDMCF